MTLIFKSKKYIKMYKRAVAVKLKFSILLLHQPLLSLQKVHIVDTMELQ